MHTYEALVGSGVGSGIGNIIPVAVHDEAHNVSIVSVVIEAYCQMVLVESARYAERNAREDFVTNSRSTGLASFCAGFGPPQSTTD
jgi:hypothetical protein